MRPRGGHQFRPVSYANLDPETRRLAAFIAISRDRLPSHEKSDPRTRLVGYSLSGAVAGWIVLRFFFGPEWAALGAVLCALAGCIWVGTSTFAFSSRSTRRRATVIRTLDDARRSTGLDHALESPLKEQLEACAADWEYIEHRLADRLWQSQPELKTKIQSACHVCTERLIVAAILGDDDPATSAERLADLRHCVDSATTTLESYPRASEYGTGAPLQSAFTEVVELEALINQILLEG